MAALTQSDRMPGMSTSCGRRRVQGKLDDRQHLPLAERCPLGQCAGGRLIRRFVVDRTKSPTVGMNLG